MLGTNSVTTTLNIVLRDEAFSSTENSDSDGDNGEVALTCGPALPVKVTVGYGQIYIEFTNVQKEIIYGDNPEDRGIEHLSITVDYFNNQLQVLHNGNGLVRGVEFDDSEAVNIIAPVTKYIEKNPE